MPLIQQKHVLRPISHFCVLKKIHTSAYNTLTFTLRFRVSNRVRVSVQRYIAAVTLPALRDWSV